MPRTNIGNKYRRADWTAADAAIVRQIGRLMGETRMTRGEVAASLHISEHTLRRRMSDPSQMTKEEERRLFLLCQGAGFEYKPAFEEVRFV